MIDLHPTKCNICGGKVEYVELEEVYGRHIKYQNSGFCYHCTRCGAIVGTHKDRPDEAMGLLADKELGELRQKAHKMFDKFWLKKGNNVRTACYQKLADEMGVPFEECHFAYFTKEQLEQAYTILVKWWREKYDR